MVKNRTTDLYSKTCYKLNILKQIIQLFLFTLGFLPLVVTAQQVTGKVMDEQQEPLIGVNLYWAKTNLGTVTDTNGYFELSAKDQSTNQLIISYVGYEIDTIVVLSLIHI